MPGRQQLCVLCRITSHPARISSQGGRAASQLRSLEPYDASKLVLDLDAADCKYVRRYEDESEATNAHIYKPVQKQKAKAKLETSYKPSEVEDVYRPAPIDFLTYTFWGDNSGRIFTSRRIFRDVAARCLRRRLGNHEDRVKWLFAYAALPYKLDSILARSHETDERARMDIRTMFHGCETLFHIRRITALMARNLDGCRFVAKYATFILQTVELEVRRALTDQGAGLIYINSVIQRLEAMGVDPGPGWYGAGLYHAARGLNFPALKKYIDVAGSKDGSCERIDYIHLRRTLEVLYEFAFDRQYLSEIRESRSVASLKRDILRILTGWDKEGVPQNGEIQDNCFAMLLRDDEKITNLYFKILLRLGADSALRHELNSGCFAPLVNHTGSGDNLKPPWRSSLREQILLHFKQPLQSLQVLLSQEHTLEDRASTIAEREVTANPSVSEKQHLRQTLIGTLGKRYVTQPAVDINVQNLSGDLKQFGLYTAETMSTILRILSTYWPLHRDQSIRRLIYVDGPYAPVCRNASKAISRRLTVIGEVEEDRYDEYFTATERINVQRLRQLQADLQSLSFWTEDEDDLLQTLVEKSWHGDTIESKVEEDWEFMAGRIAESLPEREIPHGAFMCKFLERRYKRIMFLSGRRAEMVEAEVSSQSNEEGKADEASSLNVSDDIDAFHSPGGR